LAALAENHVDREIRAITYAITSTFDVTPICRGDGKA